MDPFSDVQIQVRELLAAEDCVIVIVHATGRGKGSGLEIDTEFAHVLTVRKGRVLRLQAFFDRARALEVVGLEDRGAPAR